MATGFFAMVAGLILVVVPLVMRTNAWRRRRTWKRADGAITSVRQRKDPNQESRTTVIRYRFADAGGTYHGGTDTTMFRKPRRGSRISVRYYPHAPESNEPAVNLPIMMVFIVGLPVLGAGLTAWGFLDMVGA